MRDHRDAKLMATALAEALAADGQTIPRSRALEIVAAQFGLKDWNTLAASIEEPAHRFTETCPIMRSFDEGKARGFYLDYLGFTLDWEHRFAPGMPLYFQVSRAGLILHVSEHHGDATPGSTVFVRMKGIRAFHAELRSRKYPLAPGLEKAPWGHEFQVRDPFGNMLRFCEG